MENAMDSIVVIRSWFSRIPAIFFFFSSWSGNTKSHFVQHKQIYYFKLLFVK
jgi:hypothetical protein